MIKGVSRKRRVVEDRQAALPCHPHNPHREVTVVVAAAAVVVAAAAAEEDREERL